MTSLPPIHLCMVQPAGYVHWMALLDQARYYRYQFRRLGAEVSLAKNRLRHDAINFVFGAHNGFDPALRTSHCCVFVNLEQIGADGASVSKQYLDLLAKSAVVDYDAANVLNYAQDVHDVPIARILHAPYLRPDNTTPLEERPIDLLFIGSMNPRRKAWLDRVEATGHSVATFDAPLYGEQRDHWIRQAKAVLNVHFYESCRFEQARVSHCLSLGTPVISERTALTNPPSDFDDCVLWLQGSDLEQFFKDDFGTPVCFEALRTGLQRFERTDALNDYDLLLEFARGYHQAFQHIRGAKVWRPSQINLGSGKDYKPGWLNLDVLERTQPDLVIDLCREINFPIQVTTAWGRPFELVEGSVEVIHANNVLEHVQDLPALMTNCLRLLRLGGEMQIEVPYERAATAWQDPTHVRAMNENSWIYYEQWFWYLGWYEHRYEMTSSAWLDTSLKPCEKQNAAFMRVTLRKIETTPQERMIAQAMQPDIRLPEDDTPVPPTARLSTDSPVVSSMRVPADQDLNSGQTSDHGSEPDVKITTDEFRRRINAMLGSTLHA